MATVLTTVTPALIPFTYSVRVREPLAWRPAREIRAVAIAASIASTGVGDNQSLLIDVDLPKNYAYSILEAYLSLHSGSSAMNWGLNVFAEWAGAATVSRTLFPLNFVSPGTVTRAAGATIYATRNYDLQATPKVLILPETNAAQVHFHVSTYNATSNDVLYLVDFVARFQQWDLRAANDAGVNTPLLVRG